MSDIANLGKIHYCEKKTGNNGAHCSSVAAYKVTLESKKNNKKQTQYRCGEHVFIPTSGKKVVYVDTYDQHDLICRVSAFLNQLIGKQIVSSFHSARSLTVKYVKIYSGGIMCFQEHSRKWKFVFYEQITKIL